MGTDSNGRHKHLKTLPTEQVPPSNTEAEKLLLSSIFLGGLPTARAVCKSLKIAHFYDTRYATVFTAIVRLVEDGRPVDALSVAEELAAMPRGRGDALLDIGGAPIIADIAEASATSAQAETYAAAIIDRAAYRAVIQIGTEAVEESYRPRASAAETVEAIRGRFDRLLSDLAESGVEGLEGDRLSDSWHDCGEAELRPAIIDGLLREREVCNIIAPPKTGKSWLVMNLALSMSLGRDWLGFRVKPGRVLMVDNELHRETIAWRLPRVAEAMGIDADGSGVRHRLHIASLRGRLMDLESLLKRLEKEHDAGFFQVVILDAWYRFLADGMSENDNASMTKLYTLVDTYAERLKCAFVLVHHSSKGNQGDKAVTDVGAGAGSAARATDTHLIIREHTEPSHYVIDAAIRSFPPVTASAWRWEWPLFRESDADPSDLKRSAQAGRYSASRAARDAVAGVTPEEFVSSFIDDPAGVHSGSITAAARAEGYSERQISGLLKAAMAQGILWRVTMAGGEKGYTADRTRADSTDEEIAEWVRAERAAGRHVSRNSICDKYHIGKSRASAILGNL